MRLILQEMPISPVLLKPIFSLPINATQATYGGGPDDAFVAKFVRGQNTPVYLSYLGGTGKDLGYAIAIDGNCGIYVSGWTKSLDFPSSNPYPTPFLPKQEGGFLTKIYEDGCPCQPHADFTFATYPCNRTVKFTDTSVQDISSLGMAVRRWHDLHPEKS